MTGCPNCDDLQRRTGSSTIMCPRCTMAYSIHEYQVAKKRIKLFALAQRQEENGYIEEQEIEL